MAKIDPKTAKDIRCDIAFAATLDEALAFIKTHNDNVGAPKRGECGGCFGQGQGKICAVCGGRI